MLLGIAGVRFPHQLVCLPDQWLEVDDQRIVEALQKTEMRDSVYFHDKEQMVDRNDLFWSLRKDVLFSAHLVNHAREFQTKHSLDSRPYVAMHLRRGDFLRVHSELVPSLLEVVKIMKLLLAEHEGISHVFVATDGTLGRGHGAKADVEYIQKRAPKGVTVLQYTDPKDTDLHMGEFALVEQILCTQAEFFIGTQTSMFSDIVMQERALHGKPQSSAALFEGEMDVGYDRPRAPGSDGVLRERGYDSMGYASEPYTYE